MTCFSFYREGGRKKKEEKTWACCVCSVAMFLIFPPPSLLRDCLENLPSEQMASAGRRLEAGTWALYAAHTHSHIPISSTHKKEGEQRRSVGNFTTGLFWETVHMFVYRRLARGSDVDTGEQESSLASSAGVIPVTLIVHHLNAMSYRTTPIATEQHKEEALVCSTACRRLHM